LFTAPYDSEKGLIQLTKKKNENMKTICIQQSHSWDANNVLVFHGIWKIMSTSIWKCAIRLENMLSGRQSCKGMNVLQHFRDWRQGQSQALKHWRTSTSWQVHLP